MTANPKYFRNSNELGIIGVDFLFLSCNNADSTRGQTLLTQGDETMADKVTIITAIRNVTTRTKQGVDKHSKAQEARERQTAKELLILLGIEKPSQSDCDACYPW